MSWHTSGLNRPAHLGRLTVVLILMVGVVLFKSTTSSGVVRAHSTPAGPTLSVLEGLVTSSVAINHAPDLSSTIPPLLSIQPSDMTVSNMHAPCYTLSQPVAANSATLCAWGDTLAPRSILLYGDSQAAMWLPAFNQLGKDLGWKIIFFGRSNCAPWINPNTTAFDGSPAGPCNVFVKQEIAYAVKNKPAFIFPLGLAGAWGKAKRPTKSQLEGEMNKMLTALKPSGSKIILLGKMPQFETTFTKYSPATCLVVRSNNVTSCEVTPTQVATGPLAGALPLAAASSSVPLIDVKPLFCTSARCGLFVVSPTGTRLIYMDGYHMNRWYSAWISVALEGLLKNTLPA